MRTAVLSLAILICSALPLRAQTPDTVFLEDLTWMEVRDAIASGKTTVIIPTGGTEQNGPHMVLGKHNFLVKYKAGEVAKRLGNALVAPVMAYVPEGNIDPPSGHMRFAGTPQGLGIHALNLDADVGPWLQVLKLRGLKDDAERAGRTNLTGPEIELMNLAGPRTGLEMLTPVAQNMPTSNFFSQGGYYRNTIVRDKTAIELLRALEGRMDVNIKKPGAVEFAQIFDEVARK